LGLGLAFAKNIAQVHGGNIEARSEGAGKGSVFILRLPVLPGFEKTPQKSMKNVKSGTPVSILLIEDNKSLAEMQSALFKIGRAHV
jgi:nitrogen fixation/metabolism regulation signal transduction histidine kinase